MRLTTLLTFGLLIVTNAVFAQVAAPSTTPANNAAATTATASPASTTSAVAPVATNIVSSGVIVASGNVSIPATAIINPSNNTNQASFDALPTSSDYGNSVYPGAATFMTPLPSKSVSPLYRIASNENVTFAWSFTNMLVRPVSLTLAAVAPNSVTYTVTSLAGDATSAVWYLSNVPTASPLMMGMYKIQLYDQRGPSAIIQPGWLAPLTTLSIAFYSGESYQVSSGSAYCPLCFYSAGFRLTESFGPIAIAFGVATVTSAFILRGLLY